MKLSKNPRHFAPRKKPWGNKNNPHHRSSGRGNRVIPLDPCQVLGRFVEWLKRVR